MTHPWDPTTCETVEYRSASGDVVRFLMRAGARERLMPPVKVTTLPVPAQVGSRLLGSFHTERAVTIPVAFPGPLTDRAELRRWAQVLDPMRGEGTLTVVGGPSPGRFLRCVYEAGLDDLEEAFPSVNLGALIFRAAWPYWLDPTEQSQAVAQGTSTLKWFPFLPLVLGASDAFATFTVTVTGDVPSWPIITVKGPGTDATVTNLTTGASWTVSGAVAAGSTLTVDTRPSFKSVSIDGANAFNRLTPGSSLWALRPGGNQIQVSFALTSPASLVTFAWRNQWLAA
jgi:hypothetical protein